jgi:hypothetical protein
MTRPDTNIIKEPDYKQILINLCASAFLADHMGDMAGDIDEALIQAGIITRKEAREFEDLSQLAGFLALEHRATTINGTAIGGSDD